MVDKTSSKDEKLYSLCREMAKNQDELTNHRLSWGLAIQGGLFAAYVACLHEISADEVVLASKKLDSVARATLLAAVGDLRTAVWCIGIIGVGVSIVICLATIGAQIAIVSIERYLIENCWDPEAELSWWNTHFRKWPGILGGGERLAHILGMLPPVLIPILFALVWIVFLTRMAGPSNFKLWSALFAANIF